MQFCEDALTDWCCMLGLQWQITEHFSSSMLPSPITFCFWADLFSHSHSLCSVSSSVFQPLHPSSFPSHLFSSLDQTQGPTFHIIPLFLSLDHHSIHLSFITVSSRSLVGAYRWQACVCLALQSAFLMSLKHRGSAHYGDEEIQAGQKVTDLANRGPLRSSTPPWVSSSHSSFPQSISVCSEKSNDGMYMLNRSCGLLLLLLFFLILLSFCIYLFIL